MKTLQEAIKGGRGMEWYKIHPLSPTYFPPPCLGGNLLNQSSNIPCPQDQIPSLWTGLELGFES